MGKSDPPSTPSAKPDPTLADLLAEFKTNQEGNKRIEDKLNTLDKKSEENAKAIKEHITRYEADVDTLNSRCDGFDSKTCELEDRLNGLARHVKELDDENLSLRKRVYQLKKDSKICIDREEDQKRLNILIQGIPESAYKKTK